MEAAKIKHEQELKKKAEEAKRREDEFKASKAKDKADLEAAKIKHEQELKKKDEELLAQRRQEFERVESQQKIFD